MLPSSKLRENENNIVIKGAFLKMRLFDMIGKFISDHIKKNDYAHLAEREIILHIPLGRGEFCDAKFFILLIESVLQFR